MCKCWSVASVDHSAMRSPQFASECCFLGRYTASVLLLVLFSFFVC